MADCQILLQVSITFTRILILTHAEQRDKIDELTRWWQVERYRLLWSWTGWSHRGDFWTRATEETWRSNFYVSCGDILIMFGNKWDVQVQGYAAFWPPQNKDVFTLVISMLCISFVWHFFHLPDYWRPSSVLLRPYPGTTCHQLLLFTECGNHCTARPCMSSPCISSWKRHYSLHMWSQSLKLFLVDV